MDSRAFSRLLGRKQQAVQELLHAMQEWDETGAFGNEACFNQNIGECQKELDEVKRIDDTLKAFAGREDFLPSHDDAERMRKTNEMLRQAQSVIGRYIRQITRQMAEVSQEASMLRQRKNGIDAYRNNGIPSRRERVDVRG